MTTRHAVPQKPSWNIDFRRFQPMLNWWVDISLSFTQNNGQPYPQHCLTSTVRWFHGFGRFSGSDRQTPFWRFSPFFTQIATEYSLRAGDSPYARSTRFYHLFQMEIRECAGTRERRAGDGKYSYYRKWNPRLGISVRIWQLNFIPAYLFNV